MRDPALEAMANAKALLVSDFGPMREMVEHGHEVVIHDSDALGLDVDAIALDAPVIPGGILGVLRETQRWLRSEPR